MLLENSVSICARKYVPSLSQTVSPRHGLSTMSLKSAVADDILKLSELMTTIPPWLESIPAAFMSLDILAALPVIKM